MVAGSVGLLGSVGELSKFYEDKPLDEALHAVELMVQHGIPISRESSYIILQKCTKNKDLSAGRRVYSLMVITGLDSVAFLGNYLIRLFASGGSLVEANQVFWKLAEPSVYTWNAIISAHAKLGEGGRAVDLHYKMQQGGIKPNKVTFLSLLKACHSIGAVRQGRIFHDQINRSGLGLNLVIGNTLIDMYGKCGCLEDARNVFNNLPYRDVVSWCAMIAGYAQQENGLAALELFEEMQQQSTKPDKVTFLSTLKACVSTEAIEQGRQIHEKIMKSGFESDVVIGSTLVDTYCKYWSLDEARKIFDGLPVRNGVSWGAMIAGYAQHGHGLPALELFAEMQLEGVKPDKITFLCILKACSSIGAIGEGRLIHEQIKNSGLGSDVIVGSALVDLYAKCGSLEEAHKVFDQLSQKNVEVWGAMIGGYSDHGHGLSALELFKTMLQEGIAPTKGVLFCILKACTTSGALGEGRLIHEMIVRAELDSDVVAGSTLVNMYAKAGSMEEACKMFDELLSPDAVCWGAMISGYAENGHGVLALELFQKMQQNGIKPDKVTCLCAVKACGCIQGLDHGKLIHEQIVKYGFSSDVVVGNCVLDMYVKCGNLNEAQRVLDGLTTQNLISWSAMITGYAEHGHGFLALELFEEMRHTSVKPNKVTYLAVLKACGSTGAVGQGRLIHDQIIRDGLILDLALGSMLVEMYASSGSLDEARNAFDRLLDQDSMAWGAMIAGYAQHGDCRFAMQCFEDMQTQGLKPNNAILTSILGACSNAGLLREGWRYFLSMKENGIRRRLEHFSCMIDLLGRSGHLNDAKYLLQTMPVPPNAIIWTSLLTSCKTYGNMELGRHCFDEVVCTHPNDGSSYLLMSNIFADAHLWQYVSRLHEWRKCAGAQKEPGRAWIEDNNVVREFVVGGICYPECDVETYVQSRRLNGVIKLEGFVPQVDVIISGEHRENVWSF